MPYITKTTLGGIIMPSNDPDATVPVANLESYFLLSISGKANLPIVPAIAALDPEQAAKRPHAPIVAKPNPPGNHPSQFDAVLYAFVVIPAAKAKCPIRIKSGIGKRDQLATLEKGTVPRISITIWISPMMNKPTKDIVIKEIAIGTLKQINKRSPPNIKAQNIPGEINFIISLGFGASYFLNASNCFKH
jgi:hypothetical protein